MYVIQFKNTLINIHILYYAMSTVVIHCYIGHSSHSLQYVPLADHNLSIKTDSESNKLRHSKKYLIILYT